MCKPMRTGEPHIRLNIYFYRIRFLSKIRSDLLLWVCAATPHPKVMFLLPSSCAETPQNTFSCSTMRAMCIGFSSVSQTPNIKSLPHFPFKNIPPPSFASSASRVKHPAPSFASSASRVKHPAPISPPPSGVKHLLHLPN
jgi:hypothetical protein